MVILLTFALGPMLLAASAHENHRHLVLRRLRIADSLMIAAPLAHYVLAAGQRGILDALRVHLQVLCAHREVCAVDAVVSLAVLVGHLLSIAESALEYKVWPLIIAHLLGIEHVVAL